MGFGTLFIGYFLALNVTYYSLTDAVMALVMTMGLLKSAKVNRYFKYSFIISAIMIPLGLFELGVTLFEILDPTFNSASLLSYTVIPRHLILGSFTVLILLAIRDVAREVELNRLAERCRGSLIVSGAVYFLSALCEIPFGSASEGILRAAATVGVVVLFLQIITVIYNLVTVYTAYMRICMPEELDNTPSAPKTEFGRRADEHRREKAREYAEYRIEKMNKKNNRRKK